MSQWGDLRLTAYEIPPRQSLARRRPDSRWPFTGAPRPNRRWRTRWCLSLLGTEGEVIHSFETWPGWGTFPHPWMTHHTDYRDDYIMGIPPGAASTPDLQLEIRWYVFPDGPALDAELATGVRLEALRLPLGRA